jgi:O-antigen/teichoic acid export membrane protein
MPARKIVNGILSGGGLTAVSALSSLLLLRLVFQHLPADLVGVWLLFITLGGYSLLLDLGTGPTLAREISFVLGNTALGGEERRRALANIVVTCVTIFMVLMLLVVVLAVGVGLWFIPTLVAPEQRAMVGLAWWIFSAGAALNLFGGAGFSILYGLGEVAAERVCRMASLLVGFTLSAGLLLTGHGLVGLSIGWLLQGMVARIIAVCYIRRHHGGLLSGGRASAELVRRIAGPSLRWATTSLGGVLILQTGTLMVSLRIGTSAVGPYEAVSKIFNLLMTLALLIVTSSSPFLSRAHAGRDDNAFKSLLFASVKYSVAVMAVLGGLLAFYTEPVIGLWLGKGVFAGQAVVWPLLIMLILEVHHVALATGSMASGRRFFVTAALLAGAINLGLAYVLAPLLGLWGVALAVFLAQILTNNWYVPYVTLNDLHVSWRRYSREVILPLLLLLGLCLAAARLLRFATANWSDSSSVLLAVALLPPFGALMTFLLVCTAEERQRVVQRVQTGWRSFQGGRK